VNTVNTAHVEGSSSFRHAPTLELRDVSSVALDQRPFPTVARQFLPANGLL
jgi:hypothetical protein